MQRLKIFLVDDHPLLRDGLHALIEGQPDMTVVGEAGDGANLSASVGAAQPDLVIIDVAMPAVGGATATQQLLRDFPAVKMLALTAHAERGYVEQMLAAGAKGYVLKRAAAQDLVRAIRFVASGGTYVDPSVAGALVAGMVGRQRTKRGVAVQLSERETEVLRLIARGHVLKEIAALLEVGVRTVETYRSRAMAKMALKSRADVIRFAAEHGWLTET